MQQSKECKKFTFIKSGITKIGKNVKEIISLMQENSTIGVPFPFDFLCNLRDNYSAVRSIGKNALSKCIGKKYVNQNSIYFDRSNSIIIPLPLNPRFDFLPFSKELQIRW